jgi:hypothetical protein
MRPKEYLPSVAFEQLRELRIVEDYCRETYERKQYWLILWAGDAAYVSTAVGATQYQTSNIPFGIQNALLRRGVVEEVALFSSNWDYYYRIPAAVLRQIPTTLQDDRKLFQITQWGELTSKGTPRSVSILKYQILLGA